jgi:hypothetical protein
LRIWAKKVGIRIRQQKGAEINDLRLRFACLGSTIKISKACPYRLVFRGELTYSGKFRFENVVSGLNYHNHSFFLSITQPSHLSQLTDRMKSAIKTWLKQQIKPVTILKLLNTSFNMKFEKRQIFYIVEKIKQDTFGKKHLDASHFLKQILKNSNSFQLIKSLNFRKRQKLLLSKFRTQFWGFNQVERKSNEE